MCLLQLQCFFVSTFLDQCSCTWQKQLLHCSILWKTFLWNESLLLGKFRQLENCVCPQTNSLQSGILQPEGAPSLTQGCARQTLIFSHGWRSKEGTGSISNTCPAWAETSRWCEGQSGIFNSESQVVMCRWGNEADQVCFLSRLFNRWPWSNILLEENKTL